MFETEEKSCVCLIKYYDFDRGKDVFVRVPVEDIDEAESVAYEYLEMTDCGDLQYALVEQGEDWEDADIVCAIGQ